MFQGNCCATSCAVAIYGNICEHALTRLVDNERLIKKLAKLLWEISIFVVRRCLEMSERGACGASGMFARQGIPDPRIPDYFFEIS